MAKYTMRYIEILTEANADYSAMFRFLSTWQHHITMALRSKFINLETGHHIDNILDKAIVRSESEIQWARKYLKRYDRIIWWLKFVRVCLLTDMKTKLSTLGNDPYAIKYRNLADQIIKRSTIKASPADVKSYYYDAVKRDLEHLYSLPVADIQNFQPDNQNPILLVKRFKAFEKAWQSSRKGLIPQDAADGRILLEFPNGLVWMQLDRAACKQEGDAMGHCGNTVSQQKGETLLSLREPVKKEGKMFWKPYLTFVLGADGKLGEMKGRFNLNPSKAHRQGAAPSDFHNEIEALLRLPIIRGIRGGGYKPEQNFHIDDLGAARRDNLLHDRPHLAWPADRNAGDEDGQNDEDDDYDYDEED